MFVTLFYFRNALELSDASIEKCLQSVLLYTCGKGPQKLHVREFFF